MNKTYKKMCTIDRKVIRLIIICLRVYENSYSNPCLLPSNNPVPATRIFIEY